MFTNVEETEMFMAFSTFFQELELCKIEKLFAGAY